MRLHNNTLARAALSQVPCAIVAALAVSLCSTARAQTVVFDNGNPDSAAAIGSDVDDNTGFVADDFTFAQTTTFNTVRWFGIYNGNSGNTPTEPDAFTVSFFDTTGGVPNISPITGLTFNVGNPGRVDTGGNLGSFDIYSYEAIFSTPVTLNAGTFGISIVNDTTADTDDNWGWATSNQTGAFYFRNSATNPWNTFNDGDMAFQLVQGAVAVPETGSLALLLPALGVLGAVVARRKW